MEDRDVRPKRKHDEYAADIEVLRALSAWITRSMPPISTDELRRLVYEAVVLINCGFGLNELCIVDMEDDDAPAVVMPRLVMLELK